MNDIKLQAFNIKGERCSGTNYLQKLIETNFNIECAHNIDWKHGWCNLVDIDKKTLETSVTIIIFRDPFDWLRSCYLTPHHIEGTVFGIWKTSIPTFSEFIRKEEIEFYFYEETKTMKEDVSIFRTRHPFYLTRPKNIFELRKWKIEYFLNLKNIFTHTYYLKYEDLVQDPKKIITEINDKYFNIDLKFKNWTQYKETDDKYIPKKYFDIAEDDYSFLVENIDWEFESKIGYSCFD